MQTVADKAPLTLKQRDILVQQQKYPFLSSFRDNRPEAVLQQKLRKGIENSTRTCEMAALQDAIHPDPFPELTTGFQHFSSVTAMNSASPIQLGKADNLPYGRKKRQSRKLLRQISVHREQRAEKRSIQDKKERLWKKVYSLPHAKNPQYDKHTRKDAMARKSGIFADEEENEDVYLPSALETEIEEAPTEDTDTEEGLLTDMQETGSGKKGHVPRVQNKVPVNVIAAEFTNGLHKWGLHPFLSGGSAITYQGGPRPLGDLDFRITMDEGGFGSFSEPRGKELIQYINAILLPLSRTQHSEHNMAPVYAFTPMGANALTIGTSSWFGVEVSLSLVFFPPTRIVPAQDVDPHNPLIDILSLQDLRADKLKALISRRKSGEESLKKIAKDLFDFLSVCWMMQEDEEEQNMQLDMEEATSGKLGEYSFVNHDGQRWTGTPPAITKEIMQARAILTARAHLVVKARIEAFSDLIDEITLYVKSIGNSMLLDLLQTMPEMLRNMSHIRINPFLQESLRPWFEEWNQSPSFAPPPLFKRLTGPVWKGDMASYEPSATQIIDEGNPELDARMQAYPEELSADEQIILKILVACNGLRSLPDRYTPTDVLKAFGMSRGKFDSAWKSLQKKKLVFPTAAGLQLTQTGEDAFL
ncbi:MAG: hypothetical protein LIP00_00940 [Parabacteroides sp.]|nr:hypothetical protein [Parabacteroides sp.]